MAAGPRTRQGAPRSGPPPAAPPTLFLRRRPLAAPGTLFLNYPCFLPSPVHIYAGIINNGELDQSAIDTLTLDVDQDAEFNWNDDALQKVGDRIAQIFSSEGAGLGGWECSDGEWINPPARQAANCAPLRQGGCLPITGPPPPPRARSGVPGKGGRAAGGRARGASGPR